MRVLILTALAATAGVWAAAMPGRARGVDSEAGITGPFVHGNLAIYFVLGPSAEGPVPLTLQEAMAKGTVHVLETGSVNELKIENAGDEEVFIQSGDIVKGGRQDRVLTVSFVLPPKSGEVPVASYCVEHGRWSRRGPEDAYRFASSYNSIPSRTAKLAMKAPLPEAATIAGRTVGGYYPASETGARQSAVWAEVAKTQGKLSAGLNEPVAAPPIRDES